MLVYEQGVKPCGGASKAQVTITLWGAGSAIAGRDAIDGTLVSGECLVIPDNSGYWQADLVPNGQIVPTGTTYRIDRKLGCTTYTSYISVPAEGGPYEAFTIEDDPMNSITPSQLASHAGDLALHGGGIEVDYSEITSTVTVTGSSTVLQYVTGLHVVIPDVPRPVYVMGSICYNQASGGPTSATVALTNGWDGTPGGTVSVLGIKDFQSTTSGLGATDIRAALFLRVAPGTPGTIAVVARGDAANWTVDIAGSSLQKSSIRAVTA